MPNHDMADAQRFEQMIQRAVRQILVAPDPEQFLAWALEHLPELLGLREGPLEPNEQRRLSYLLGSAIWNATPQPTDAFQIHRLKPHPADERCPCGSGDRYDDCCGGIEDLPELASELVWEILLEELPEQGLREALSIQAVPEPLLAQIAERWLDEDRPRRATALLEPIFAGALDDLDAEYEPAIDILCDAYDRLGYTHKKQRFLERLCAEGSRALRAVAWQRRCTMAIDEGTFGPAQDAFEAALRSDPDNPGTAILEITLLAAQHQNWVARERARFWRRRFRNVGLEHAGLDTFLSDAIDDPQQALIASQADSLDPMLLDLTDWIDQIHTRPLPDYRLEPVQLRAPDWLPGQLTLFDDVQLQTSDVPSERAASPESRHDGITARLIAPGELQRLESDWTAIYPGTKPTSTQLAPSEEIDLWSNAAWLEQLLTQPALADSLEVLDDLATALYLHPESAYPWVSHRLLRPLLERAGAILDQLLTREGPCQTPWLILENRPALRLLFRLYLCRLEERESQAAVRTLETLLELNPRDHHGIRAELMNHYLRDGEDERALALARRFPNDALADLAYGEVLALYRLGRQERARLVLSTAINRLPSIPRYLTRKRIKQPRLSAPGNTPGSDDQAWLYREAMRDVWEAEPGILAWLRRMTA
ncbi:hypothetical protein CKO25_10285 [Thiocapsa imhoffii]|uniref:SEC-C domain-containing protein n=1 Tax=Thiocapsa imhoffii TaxID=382777 RepID=A0A9X1B8Q0_9GAMM|nr:SEC-C domain-containing protein [Thiocapsa imhoffii]MBK1645032.1 hypothetical protein [Thiocapsa imhoffii]